GFPPPGYPPAGSAPSDDRYGGEPYGYPAPPQTYPPYPAGPPYPLPGYPPDPRHPPPRPPAPPRTPARAVALGGGVGSGAGVGAGAVGGGIVLDRALAKSRQAAAADPKDPFDQAVQTALDGRTHALRAKNEKAYLASVDPAAKAALAAERRLYENLVQIPYS